MFDGNAVGILDGTVLGITISDELGSLDSSRDDTVLGISLKSFEGISVVDDGPVLDKRDGLCELKLGKIDGGTLASVGIFIFDAVGTDDVNDNGASLSLLDGIALTSTVGLELNIDDGTVNGSKLATTDSNMLG